VPCPSPRISPELLEAFKQLYEAEFDKKLSGDEALEKATHLLNLFRAIYRPIPKARAHVYSELQTCYKKHVTPTP
jgi:hypothetical protein